MAHRDFIMPRTGEGWRHYKGGADSLYTIIGLSRDENGCVHVVYTPYGWSLAELPPIYNQPLGRFLQEVENKVPRFAFDRDAGGDDRCPFIRA